MDRTALDAIVDAIQAFFEQHEGASIKLPSGWLGGPTTTRNNSPSLQSTDRGFASASIRFRCLTSTPPTSLWTTGQ